MGANAAPGDAKVTLTWGTGQASDVASFKIYRDTEPGVATNAAHLLATQPIDDGTTYVDNDVVNGTTYYYKITAVDEADNESEASTQVSATPVPDPDLTAPAVPGRRHRHGRRRERHGQLGRGHRVLRTCVATASTAPPAPVAPARWSAARTRSPVCSSSTRAWSTAAPTTTG